MTPKEGDIRPQLAISSLFQYGKDPGIPLKTLAESPYSIMPMHHHEMHGNYHYSQKEMRDLANFVKELGLRVRDVHGTHGIEEGNPRGLCWSTNEQMRKEGVGLVKNRIDLTHALEGDVLTLHVAGIPKDPQRAQPTWDSIRRTLDESKEYARRKNVRIALENLHYPSFGNHHVIMELLSSYEPDLVGACYDTGHGNCVPDGLEFAEAVKDRIISVHLNDNTGAVNNNATDEDANKGDRHMLLYSGTANWTDIARTLAASSYFTKENGPISMETGSRRHPEIPTVEEFLAKVNETGMRFAQEIEKFKPSL